MSQQEQLVCRKKVAIGQNSSHAFNTHNSEAAFRACLAAGVYVPPTQGELHLVGNRLENLARLNQAAQVPSYRHAVHTSPWRRS